MPLVPSRVLGLFSFFGLTVLQGATTQRRSFDDSQVDGSDGDGVTVSAMSASSNSVGTPGSVSSSKSGASVASSTSGGSGDTMMGTGTSGSQRTAAHAFEHAPSAHLYDSHHRHYLPYMRPLHRFSNVRCCSLI